MKFCCPGKEIDGDCRDPRHLHTDLERLMERKRPHSPSASASDEGSGSGSGSPRLASSKVCLYAFNCIDSDTDLDPPRGFHDFYVFDLNQKPGDDDNGGFISMKHALRFKFADFSSLCAVCVLNSTIYVLSSTVNLYNTPTKSVSSYSLSDGTKGSTLYMNGYKYRTSSVASPDCRKMLVFSKTILIRDRCPGFIDFELFDSTTKEFRILPAFFPESMEFPEEVNVRSYAFLDEEGSTFVIEIDDERHTMFSLDLKALDPVWVKCGGGGGPWSSLIEPVFFVLGGSLCFNYNAFAAYDFKKDELVYDIPGPSDARRPPGKCRGNMRLVAFLDQGKCDGRGGHRLCVVDSNYDQVPWDVPAGAEPILDHPCVHIAVYELKVASCCGQELPPQPTATALKFILDSYRYTSFFPISLYPLWD